MWIFFQFRISWRYQFWPSISNPEIQISANSLRLRISYLVFCLWFPISQSLLQIFEIRTRVLRPKYANRYYAVIHNTVLPDIFWYASSNDRACSRFSASDFLMKSRSSLFDIIYFSFSIQHSLNWRLPSFNSLFKLSAFFSTAITSEHKLHPRRELMAGTRRQMLFRPQMSMRRRYSSKNATNFLLVYGWSRWAALSCFQIDLPIRKVQLLNFRILLHESRVLFEVPQFLLRVFVSLLRILL